MSPPTQVDPRQERRIYKKISRRLRKSLDKRRALTLSSFGVLRALRAKEKGGP